VPPRDTRVVRVFGLLAFERLDARLARVARVAVVAVVAVVDEVIRARPRGEESSDNFSMLTILCFARRS